MAVARRRAPVLSAPRAFLTYVALVLVLPVLTAPTPGAPVLAANQLSVGTTVGVPGSTGNVVVISVRNGETVAGVQFDLLYDPALLIPEGVAAYGRTRSYSHVQGVVVDPGRLRVFVLDMEGQVLQAGEGRVAEVYFRVASDARAGSLWLGAEEVLFADEEADALPVAVVAGRFDVEDEQTADAVLPEQYRLHANYPNPFNAGTVIRYDIPSSVSGAVPVTLRIYNVLGQRVRTLVEDERPAGTYTAVWDGRNDGGGPVGSGTYVYELQAGSYTATQKMMLLK